MTEIPSRPFTIPKELCTSCTILLSVFISSLSMLHFFYRLLNLQRHTAEVEYIAKMFSADLYKVYMQNLSLLRQHRHYFVDLQILSHCLASNNPPSRGQELQTLAQNTGNILTVASGRHTDEAFLITGFLQYLEKQLYSHHRSRCSIHSTSFLLSYLDFPGDWKSFDCSNSPTVPPTLFP